MDPKQAASTLSREIRSLEERLLAPEVRRSQSALEALLGEDFVEFGASGRSYDRPAAIRALTAESGTPSYTLSEFSVALLAPGVVLARYRLVVAGEGEPVPETLRSSIWVERDGAWRNVFHQGTPAVTSAEQP